MQFVQRVEVCKFLKGDSIIAKKRLGIRVLLPIWIVGLKTDVAAADSNRRREPNLLQTEGAAPAADRLSRSVLSKYTLDGKVVVFGYHL